MHTIDNFVERENGVRIAFFEDNPVFATNVVEALSQRYADAISKISVDQVGRVGVAQMVSKEIDRQTDSEWKVASPYGICTHFASNGRTQYTGDVPFLNSDALFVIPSGKIRNFFGGNQIERDIVRCTGEIKTPSLVLGLEASPWSDCSYFFLNHSSVSSFNRTSVNVGEVFTPVSSENLDDSYAFHYISSQGFFLGHPVKKVTWNVSDRKFYLLDDLTNNRFPSGKSKTPLISVSSE